MELRSELIERVSAKDGNIVLLVGGRSLSSTRSPKEEAAKWVDGKSDQIHSVDSILLLGVGSVYHIMEVRTRFPDVNLIVLEKDKELLEAGKSLICEKDNSNITYLHISNFDQVAASPEIHEIFSTTYAVFSTPSTLVYQRDFYLNLEQILLGRSPIGLRYIAELSPELAGVVEELCKVVELKEPLEFRQIINTRVTACGSNAEKEMVLKLKLLEELIR